MDHGTGDPETISKSELQDLIGHYKNLKTETKKTPSTMKKPIRISLKPVRPASMNLLRSMNHVSVRVGQKLKKKRAKDNGLNYFIFCL